MTKEEALIRVKTGNFNSGYGFDMQLLVDAVGIIGKGCINQLSTETLALLKEPESVEPIAIKQERVDEFYGFVSCCPKCDCVWIMGDENDMHFCPKCGQVVKWE